METETLENFKATLKKNIDNSISDNGEFMKSIDGLGNSAEEKRQSLFDNTMFVCEKYRKIMENQIK